MYIDWLRSNVYLLLIPLILVLVLKVLLLPGPVFQFQNYLDPLDEAELAAAF